MSQVARSLRGSGFSRLHLKKDPEVKKPFLLLVGPDPFSSLHLRNRNCLETPSFEGQEVVRWHSVGRGSSLIAVGTARVLGVPV